MKNYLFYDEETANISSFKKSTCGKLTRQRIFSFSVPFTSAP